MLEVRDDKSDEVLHKQAVVYEHLSHVYEKFYIDIFGELDEFLLKLKFNRVMSELIAMSQDRRLNDLYERIMKNAI